MALPILDGNQSATTLSSILTSGEHIPAHTVVSLGTQAITDMQSAVSGSVVSISNFPATQPVSIASVTIGNTVTIAGTVTANPTGTQTIAGTVTANVADPNNVIQIGVEYGLQAYAADIANDPLPISGTVTVGNTVTIAGTVTANPTGTQTIAGTVQIDGAFNANGVTAFPSIPLWYNSNLDIFLTASTSTPFPISGTVTIGSALPAGTAQIGSVTASISNSVTIGSLPAISGTVTVGNSVTIGSLPAISGTVTANIFGLDQQDGTSNAKIPIISFDTGIEAGSGGYVVPVQISNTAGAIGASNALPISGSVAANTFALQGTAVTTSNFTSTTASTVLAGYNATREVLTIFNEGAGNLHICAGATCTTIAYQVRLSAGDYYEVPNHQTTITHSAVFATAGTARVTEVS